MRVNAGSQMIDNDPKYWFPAKRYGWGWGPPITWQGWVVFVSWLTIFFCGVWYLASRHSRFHFVFASGMVILLVIICYWKGEPPRWRWGK
jgi:hypothetical protein